MHVIGETERLVLRAFSLDDAEGMFLLNEDLDVIRYTGDPPFANCGEARTLLSGYDHYARYGFGRWSVYLKDSGEYIGWCGLNYNPSRDEVDIGFRLAREHWNRGYATEAARDSLDLGFTRFRLGKIVGRAMKDNPASYRVLNKLGMTRTNEFEQDGCVWVQYEITADQFFAHAERAPDAL